MEIEFDEGKNAQNIAKHGVSFEQCPHFEWEGSLTNTDTRRDYGEMRFISYGMLAKRLHVLVWTLRNKKIRPINFRKANLKEREIYDKKTGIY